MYHYGLWFLFILIISSLFNGISLLRISQEKIYIDLDSSHFCFRRLNATHEIGCQSDASGNVGIVHWVHQESDIEWITEKAENYPIVAVMSLDHFSTDNLLRFKRSERVSGVILVQRSNETLHQTPFSPDKSCPNDNFGLYTSDDNETLKYSHCSEQKWNRENPGLNMMFQNFPFPIFLIKDDDSIEKLRNCSEKFNEPLDGSGKRVEKSWPLCSAELFAQMHAAVSTPKCMSRNGAFSLDGSSFCSPLSSRNVFSLLIPKNDSQQIENRSLIILSSRLDSMSMFDEVSPGADSAISGLVTLLSVAHTLSRVKHEFQNSSRNIMFSVFDGESFDYIGSSSAVFDMMNNDFPEPFGTGIKPPKIGLNHISHFMEFSQTSDVKLDHKVYMHRDPVSGSRSQVGTEIRRVQEMMQRIIKSSGLQMKLEYAEETHGLPPASVQSFLKRDKNIASMVLSNHQNETENIHYNSFLDDFKWNSVDVLDNVYANQISKISQLVSSTLYEVMTGNKANLSPDKKAIQDMLECFLRNRTCQLFQEISALRMTPITGESTIPTYVSVADNSMRQQLVFAVHRLFFRLTGDQVMNSNMTSESECSALKTDDQSVDVVWMRGKNGTGICMKSATFMTKAVSPALRSDDSSENKWDSTEYSTWTESIWTKPRVRIFLKPSPVNEWLTLTVGVLILIVSFVAIYFIEKNSRDIFLSKEDLRSNLIVPRSSPVA